MADVWRIEQAVFEPVDVDSSDAALAQRASEDHEAFTELYNRYADRLSRYILSRIASRGVAEDLLIITFVRAHHAPPVRSAARNICRLVVWHSAKYNGSALPRRSAEGASTVSGVTS